MKAYIIITSDNRGRQADLTHYPSMLPTPELFFGVTPADIETPDWWLKANTRRGNKFYYLGCDGKIYVMSRS